MQEVDDRAIARARVFVDTNEAVEITGDICQPLESGVMQTKDILENLFTLAQGEGAPARPNGDEITLFKSAGAAIEDLAGAIPANRSTQK